MEIKKVNAFYFSGTKNTEYVVQKFGAYFKRAGKDFNCADINHVSSSPSFEADTILIAYPIYGGVIPFPMRRFIYANLSKFKNKNVITLITQYMFSGDGGALLKRMLPAELHVRHIASVHFNMPNNICDTQIFKIKNGNDIQATLLATDKKIHKSAMKILNGSMPKQGQSFFSRALGLSQRYFFRKKEAELRTQLQIDRTACTVCGACIKACPSKNLSIKDRTIAAADCCSLCYRCVNLCPQKAIKLTGKHFPENQYKGPYV